MNGKDKDEDINISEPQPGTTTCKMHEKRRNLAHAGNLNRSIRYVTQKWTRLYITTLALRCQNNNNPFDSST